MALFPNILFYDTTLQTNDKTRISAEKSYVSKDESAITGASINPNVGTESYIDVYATSVKDWYLDWQYASSGTYVVGVQIESGGATSSITGNITVITSGTDKLFSTDQDLLAEGPDLLKYLPAWKSSYAWMHRRAQEKMFAWIDEQGYTDVYAAKFTKADVTDTEELNEWSKYMVLKMIYKGLSNSQDDFFADKSKYYESREMLARRRFVLRIDIDGDGTVDTFEDMHLTTGRLWRK